MDAVLSEEKELVESGIASLLTATQSLELSEQIQQQVYKQQHQPPSEIQQILTEPNDEYQGVVGASIEHPCVIFIRKELELLGQDDTFSGSELCIYKVPHHLREGDNKAYVPRIVSMGPYHHGKERLLPMDRHKWRALKLFLKRKDEDIKIYFDSIKALEGKAREFYEGPIQMVSVEFMKMLVLDGCFVIELFRVVLGGLEKEHVSGISKEFEQLYYHAFDPVFTEHVCMNFNLILRDIILLENQIPLFILDRLLGRQLGCLDQRGLVAKLAANFFRLLIPGEKSLTETAFDPASDRRLHFLDVFRESLLYKWPGSLTRRSDHANCAADEHRLKTINCVAELRAAGVKFEKGNTHRFWDIKFNKKNGVLEIPKLVIYDRTKSLFLNVIAFEQCHLNYDNNFCSYALFMDHLINSSEDVLHLRHCRIIEHWLGSDDKVAELFNRLCKEVVLDINSNYYSAIYDEVNKYCSQRCHAWIADLKHKYLSNPWVIISVIAGAALLLLTITQTFYAVYGYHRPS